MREIARTDASNAEKQWGGRSFWQTRDVPDEAEIVFYLEDPTDENQDWFQYHAMWVQDEGTTVLFFGEVSEIPIAWMDASNIRSTFGVSIAEFCAPGFLASFF